MQIVSPLDEFQRNLQGQSEWDIFNKFFKHSYWQKLGMNMFGVLNLGK